MIFSFTSLGDSCSQELSHPFLPTRKNLGKDSTRPYIQPKMLTMNDQPLFDLKLGERRRDEALAAMSTKGHPWTARALNALQSINVGNDFSSDDLHRIMGEDIPPNPNYYGLVMRRFAEMGYAIEIGMIKTARPKAKARRILLYGRCAQRLGS